MGQNIETTRENNAFWIIYIDIVKSEGTEKYIHVVKKRVKELQLSRITSFLNPEQQKLWKNGIEFKWGVKWNHCP